MDIIQYRKRTYMSHDHITVKMLYMMCKSGKIQYPQFLDEQEEVEWSAIEKSYFIESILMDLPVAPIVGNGTFEGSILLYDGRNKVYTLNSFLDGGFPLVGLEVLSAYNGLRFHELPQFLQTRILNYMIDLFVVGPNTPPELADDILGRINLRPANIKRKEI